MVSPHKKTKLDPTSSRPPCPYGAICYRKNPAHFKEFSHPGDKDRGTDTPADTAASTAVSSSVALPPCKYGINCTRKNLLHFAEYSHPYNWAPTASTSSGAVADDGSDTDICDSDDEKEKKDGATKKKDGKDILNRGMSLVKSFSQMTEEERKELIQQAFEAKKQLEDEIEATKKEIEQKEKQLNTLHEELKTGVLLVDGEKEALEGNETVYFPLAPERDYKEGSAAQMHYRLAESQFYRLISGHAHSLYRVTKVDYVVTPFMVKRFRAAQEKLRKCRGEEWSSPVLGFHGTNECNIAPICEKGFKVPGEDGFQHKHDAGYYGAGVYFSEFPGYSMSYVADSTKLLLCQVLPGLTYQCNQLIMGALRKTGYDSHMSPNKKELVIFNSHHILPCYLVHYTNANNMQFTYRKARFSKRRRKAATGPDAPKLKYVGSIFTKRIVANNAPLTKIFEGVTFKYAGPAVDAKNLFKLITQHKGKKGTGAKYDILVAVAGLNEVNSKQVDKALEKDLPVVTEEFVYECILHKKFLDPDYFLHEFYDQ